MDKELKSLELVFENTDSVTIPAEFVLGANLSGITQGINIYNGVLEGSYTAKNILLKLEANPLKEVYDLFEDDDAYHRIQQDDIVCLIFHTKDGHETEVYVDWPNDSDEMTNPYQASDVLKAFLDDFDSLFVVIGKDAEFPEWLGDEDDE